MEGNNLPHPDSDPVFAEPAPEVEVLEESQQEQVNVTCAGCMTQYSFEIEPNTQSFTFECQNCHTKSTWTRV